MERIKILAAAILACLLLSGNIPANAETKGQEKLLAKRAALADAYRNLAERVKGLQIDSQTYVRDFVAVSDQVNTDLDAFLKGARVMDVTYLPDGSCEAEVGIKMRELVTELQRIKKQYQHLGHWKTIYIDRIYDYYTDDTITATGQGLPREASVTAASPITSAVPGWENVTTRGRLMAERAALVDAYRMLAERVMGLRIDSQTYVRDFVAENDQIRTDLDTFMKGIRPASPYRYLPDGICEVDVEVTIQEIVHQLKVIRRKIRYWQHVRYKTIELDRIIEIAPSKIIRVTGSGVPPAKYITGDASTSSMTLESVPGWAAGVAAATGTGIAPSGTSGAEARLMAERAAKLDAMRNLAEKIYGVKIDAATTVRDYVVEHDEVKAEIEKYLRGADVTDTRYLSDGSVEVDVEISLDGVWKAVENI